MSAASYSRTSRPRTDRVSYGRSSAGRAGAASSYRGARYVSSSLAEELSFEEAPSISVVPGAGRRAQSEGISTAALSLAKACAVICIVIALIAMARVAITSAAASCALETRSLQTSIETARAEGFDQLAALFEGVGAIEKEHEERYRKLLANVEGGLVFSRDGDMIWQCSNCGHIHVGKQAPEVCPVCAHPRDYFQLKAENY